MNGVPTQRGPRPFRRAALVSLTLAVALTAWTAYIVVTGPGDKSFIGFLIILVPPVAAAYLAVLVLPCWLVLKLAAQLGDSRRPGLLKLGMAGIAAVGLVGPILIFMLCEPRYLTPPYHLFQKIEHASRSDFTAPWGARMIALDIPAEPRVKRPAHMLWVAENELSRGEYERLTGTKVGGDPVLPMTSLSRAQIEALLKAMNGTAPPVGAAAGTYRLPRLEEMSLYSGDWWINTYPKSLFRCDSKLGPVAAQSANGLGLRATMDNAAELVVVNDAGYQGMCVTEGSVEPHCGKPYRGKSAGTSACEDRNSDKVWNHPGVGIRIVFSVSRDER